MSHLHCPFCGERELREFEFRKTLPGTSASPVARVYLRQEEQDISIEHWQHLEGCRGWLRVVRNPFTGRILQTTLLPEPAP
ncbi:MAG TPA: sarcosine oxidase subunit delta [Steroidobacteraceae bacterium]|jgi:heterotetrameric sarcosine oxidase delta subunit|nr:sarcosine oxidase subunit delta [Steroidobacteraceae bacterium]